MISYTDKKVGVQPPAPLAPARLASVKDVELCFIRRRLHWLGRASRMEGDRPEKSLRRSLQNCYRVYNNGPKIDPTMHDIAAPYLSNVNFLQDVFKVLFIPTTCTIFDNFLCGFHDFRAMIYNVFKRGLTEEECPKPVVPKLFYIVAHY